MQDSIFLRILHFLLVPGKIPNNYIFSLFFYSETNQCSLQFCLDDPIFLIAETAFCQSGFRTFSGIFRSLCIYIFFPLPGCCQHMAGSIHHRKHPADTGCILPAAVFQYNMGFSHAKCRQTSLATSPSYSSPSGVPIRKGNVLIRYPPLLVLCFCFFKHLIDVSGKQEAALRNLITRSVKDHAESTQCLF